MMKRIIFITVIILSFAINTNAEDIDASKVGFRPIVVTEDVPSNTKAYLENQVLNTLTSQGLALSDGDFVFEITVNQISKQITPTAPPQTQFRLEVVVKAIDKKRNIVLNSITMAAAGMNSSESAAYMTAVRSVAFQSRNFINFIDVSKNRLLEYYSAYTEEPKSLVEPVPESEPKPVQISIADEPTMPQAPKGVELSKGIYVEYLGVEKKNQTTDVILRFTSHNNEDEVISLRGKTHMVVDSSGRNINNRSEKYLNGDDLAYNGFILLKDVPVSIRINYSGDITPQVMFLQEARRDVKVRIEMR